MDREVDQLRRDIFDEWVRGQDSIHASIVNDLLPLARELGIIPKRESLDSIVRRMLEGSFELPKADLSQPVPKELAATAFWGILSGLLIGAIQRHAGQNDAAQLQQTLALLPEIRGYMRAMCDVQSLRTLSAAKARREEGAASKFKVIVAAQAFRGRMSKEQAAPLIAKSVNLSPATVRLMLTKLFPGREWSKSGSNESADSS